MKISFRAQRILKAQGFKHWPVIYKSLHKRRKCRVCRGCLWTANGDCAECHSMKHWKGF